MNDDLKAYVDGELPPDAAERVRAALEADPGLLREAETLRSLGAALRTLPEPESVGQAATLAALSRRRPLWREWVPALAACAAVLAVAIGIQEHRAGRWTPAVYPPAEVTSPSPATSIEASIPAARLKAFERYVRSLGGEVRRHGDGLRAFYPESAHEEVKRHFLLPEDLPWPTDGLRIRVSP